MSLNPDALHSELARIERAVRRLREQLEAAGICPIEFKPGSMSDARAAMQRLGTFTVKDLEVELGLQRSATRERIKIAEQEGWVGVVEVATPNTPAVFSWVQRPPR